MRTRWKILLAVGGFLMLFTGIWLTTMHVGPENGVEDYKKTLRDAGEKLQISELMPGAVPADQDATAAVEDAFRSFSSGGERIPNAMQMVAPGKAMAGWSQSDVRGPQFTNSWDEFAAEMSAVRPALELLKQVLERPKVDFHLDYKKGFAMPLAQLASLKRVTQSLSAATVYDLHDGNMESATADLRTMVGLVQADEHDRAIISQLVRIAMTAIASSATWEWLQATNLTDAQLAAGQKSWEQLEFFGPAEGSFLMERAMMVETIEKMRASHTEFRNIVGLSGSSSGGSSGGAFWSWPPDFDAMLDGTKATGGEIMWRTSWSYSEELHLLQGDQVILGTLRTMKTNQFLKPDYDAMMSRLSSLGITNAGAALFRALHVPDFSDMFSVSGLSGVVMKTIRIEATRRVVVTAIALKRFQFKHGHLPEKAAELVPDFLPSIPIDPYDGKPLRYRLNADGTWALYCVGEDGMDDGGDVTIYGGITSASLYWQNNHTKDWVWPQPATAAEIQYFYEHPPK